MKEKERKRERERERERDRNRQRATAMLYLQLQFLLLMGAIMQVVATRLDISAVAAWLDDDVFYQQANGYKLNESVDLL